MKFSDKYIDLHAHLDGSITVDIAKKIAKIQNIPLPNDDVLLNMLSISFNAFADKRKPYSCR